jgi:hypothetical protein
MASEPVKFWHEHLRDAVRAMDVLEKMTKDLNEDTGISDLEFMVPTEVSVMIYGEPAGFTLVLEDDAWWLKEDKIDE